MQQGFDRINLIIGDNPNEIKTYIIETLEAMKLSIEESLYYDGEENSINEIVEEVKTFPFFTEKKIVIVKDLLALSKSESINELIEYFMNPNELSYLIFYGLDFVLTDDTFSNALKLYARIVDLKRDMKPYDYVKEKFQRKGIEVSDEVIEKIITRVENKVFLDSEIEKILTYTNEPTPKIVDLLVSRSIEDNVFSLTSSLITGNRADVIKTYKNLSNQGDEIFILNTIQKKFNEILTTKLLIEKKLSQEQIAKTLNVSSGRAYYMMKNANEISLHVVKDYLKKIVDLDTDIKSGRIDKKLGLELFMLGA